VTCANRAWPCGVMQVCVWLAGACVLTGMCGLRWPPVSRYDETRAVRSQLEAREAQLQDTHAQAERLQKQLTDSEVGGWMGLVRGVRCRVCVLITCCHAAGVRGNRMWPLSWMPQGAKQTTRLHALMPPNKR